MAREFNRVVGGTRSREVGQDMVYTWAVFTGIVQAVGKVGVKRPDSTQTGKKLSVVVPNAWPEEPWVAGESVAVDGCCLTLVLAGETLEFDLSQETLERTTLGSLTEGTQVNLERAMKASDRFGGHIVQGHIDCTGQFRGWDTEGVARFGVSEEKLLVDKGSIAIDGVSLTVVQPKGGEFTVALVPHTLANTTFNMLTKGQRVNVEFDVLAKYVLNRQ